jgi:hypothetical protein
VRRFIWPSSETEADAWAIEALASFPGTRPCWQYLGEVDAFVAPPLGRRRRRAIEAERVEALRRQIDPEVAA